MNKTRAQILSTMKAHQPTPNNLVAFKCGLRWATVIVFSMMLPLGAFMSHQGHPWDYSGEVAILLGVLGFWGIGVGWLELRQQGLQRQWGFCALSTEQCEEFQTLVAAYPELEAEVDVWLVRWIESSSQLRGRDLLFLQRIVRQWEVATAGSLVATTNSSAAYAGRSKLGSVNLGSAKLGSAKSSDNNFSVITEEDA
jgi:hypothetical protein